METPGGPEPSAGVFAPIGPAADAAGTGPLIGLALAAAGVAGCVLLAFSLPVEAVLTGAAVLGLGALVWSVQEARR